MKLVKNINALVLGLAVLLAVGCNSEDKKEDPAPANIQQPVAPKCLLLQDSSTQGWVNNYTYNAEGLVTWITRKRPGVAPYFEGLEYNSEGKLSQNNFYSSDSLFYAYNLYQYNANGQISSSTIFSRKFATEPFTENGHETFVYNASGMLIERSRFSSSQATQASGKYVFTHRPDGVIEEKSYNNYSGNNNFQLGGIMEYRYDNQYNPYSTLSNAINMPIFTHHNVISARNYDLTHAYFSEFTVTYQYNLKGFPVSAVHFDGPKQVDTFYTYNCQ